MGADVKQVDATAIWAETKSVLGLWYTLRPHKKCRARYFVILELCTGQALFLICLASSNLVPCDRVIIWQLRIYGPQGVGQMVSLMMVISEGWRAPYSNVMQGLRHNSAKSLILGSAKWDCRRLREHSVYYRGRQGKRNVNPQLTPHSIEL